MTLFSDDKTQSFPIPSSRFSRMVNLGSMATGIAGNIFLSATQQFAKGQKTNFKDLVLSQSNMMRFVKHLSQMRGAAMKVGQLLSLEVGEFISPQASEVLSLLRNQAHAMPPDQLNSVLKKNWGPNFNEMFERFDPQPIAAASIGQVHRCITKNGTLLAIKVQYPGIKNSIESDIKNLKFLLNTIGLIPPLIDFDSLMEAGKNQLYLETDYLAEAEFLASFSRLVANLEVFEVPRVYRPLSTSNILAMEFKEGITLDKANTLTQRQRNDLIYNIMKLLFAEIFDFKLIQTDPNFSNFLFQEKQDKIVLLDFGATQKVTPILSKKFRTLLRATWRNDEVDIKTALTDLNILDASFPSNFEEIFMEIFLDATRPIREKKIFDFREIRIIEKIQNHAQEIISYQKKIKVPDMATLLIQRKVGGLFFLAKHLRASIDLNKLLKKYV